MNRRWGHNRHMKIGNQGKSISRVYKFDKDHQHKQKPQDHFEENIFEPEQDYEKYTLNSKQNPGYNKSIERFLSKSKLYEPSDDLDKTLAAFEAEHGTGGKTQGTPTALELLANLNKKHGYGGAGVKKEEKTSDSGVKEEFHSNEEAKKAKTNYKLKNSKLKLFVPGSDLLNNAPQSSSDRERLLTKLERIDGKKGKRKAPVFLQKRKFKQTGKDMRINFGSQPPTKRPISPPPNLPHPHSTLPPNPVGPTTTFPNPSANPSQATWNQFLQTNPNNSNNNNNNNNNPSPATAPPLQPPPSQPPVLPPGPPPGFVAHFPPAGGYPPPSQFHNQPPPGMFPPPGAVLKPPNTPTNPTPINATLPPQNNHNLSTENNTDNNNFDIKHTDSHKKKKKKKKKRRHRDHSSDRDSKRPRYNDHRR